MDLSVIIPVYNEADNLAVLCQQIQGVLRSLEVTSEVLIVDDGSTDNTFALLERLHQEDPTMRITRLSRNFGQTAALAAGLAHAQGRIKGKRGTGRHKELEPVNPACVSASEKRTTMSQQRQEGQQ